MVPVVLHEADTSHFDAKFTKLPAADLHCDDVVPADVEQLFAGFSFYGLESLVGDSIAVSIQRRRSRASSGAISVAAMSP
ncbi:hypothetical protein PINS_up001828 [Pythium insidiosum]|nr:hypothetical protein PINS_up001828 [Pythium insidiosum]